MPFLSTCLNQNVVVISSIALELCGINAALVLLAAVHITFSQYKEISI